MIRDMCHRHPLAPTLFAVLLGGLGLLSVSPAVGQVGVFVEGNKLGIGVATPTTKLDVQGSDGVSTQVHVKESNASVVERTLFNIENTGNPRFVLKNLSSGDQWVMASTAGGFVFNAVGTGVVEFRVGKGGALTIPGAMTAQQYFTSSSVTLKHDFEPVSGRDILSRLVDLPLAEWSFQDDPSGERHLGPMAEDFRTAFALGADPRQIGLMDATGVTMAAIQGLYDLVEEKDAEIASMKAELASLRAAVEALQK